MQGFLKYLKNWNLLAQRAVMGLALLFCKHFNFADRAFRPAPVYVIVLCGIGLTLSGVLYSYANVLSKAGKGKVAGAFCTACGAVMMTLCFLWWG